MIPEFSKEASGKKMTAVTSTTVSPLISFKSPIFRNHRIHPWNSNIKNSSKSSIYNNAPLLLRSSTTTRFSHFPVPIFTHNLHLLPLHFQIRHCNFLSHTHLPPLLRLSSPSCSPPMSSLASSLPPDSSPAKTVRVVIKGRVQEVFYRNWTVENAKKLGLNGWVRNRRDGSVEALFSGSDDKVREMEQRCRRGPPAAMVTALDVVPSSDDPGIGFERRPTV